MQELERQFKADGGTFEEYKIGDLFESSNGDFDIQKSHINGIGDYVITAGLTNNGILGKTDVKAKVFEPYTLTVDMFGSSFYRCFKYKMVTHARVFSMKPKLEINDEQGLYLSCSLKYLEKLFGYENMCSWEKIKALPIHLPILANGEISFSYMECVIRELQDERISSLTDYLKESGFGNTELTQEEKDAVLQLRNGEVEWKEFRYNEIFNHIEQGRRLKKDDQMPGDIPFVMSGVTNTGVVNYISNPVASFPANSITVDIFGNTFYRDFAYGLGDDTGAYYNDEKQYTKEQMLFIASAMGKSLEGKFSYGNKLRSSQSFVFKMYLPIAADGEIDWAFMQNLISAESRLAIRGVIKWKDSIGNKSQN